MTQEGGDIEEKYEQFGNGREFSLRLCEWVVHVF